MSSRLRCAVIGTGHLGRFHAEKYAALPEAELTAVVDPDTERAAVIADALGTRALSDYRQILDAVDAVSIAAPTTLHYAIARDCLEAGVHVLVEKPITVTVDEADELVSVAARQGLILQVGHLERFNAAVRELDRHDHHPVFIECHRLAPFKPRATDVDVVLDLMIHDIDIILDLVDSEVTRIDAKGVPVLTDAVDIGNARLEFANGCVANVTASRVSMKVERKMRLFLPRVYVSIDFQNRTLTRHSTGKGEMYPGVPDIVSEERTFEDGDALRAEIVDFLDCVRTGRRPLVDGVAGRRALAAAVEIGRLMGSAQNAGK